jgi:hypothetical protein
MQLTPKSNISCFYHLKRFSLEIGWDRKWEDKHCENVSTRFFLFSFMTQSAATWLEVSEGKLLLQIKCRLLWSNTTTEVRVRYVLHKSRLFKLRWPFGSRGVSTGDYGAPISLPLLLKIGTGCTLKVGCIFDLHISYVYAFWFVPQKEALAKVRVMPETFDLFPSCCRFWITFTLLVVRLSSCQSHLQAHICRTAHESINYIFGTI